MDKVKNGGAKELWKDASSTDLESGLSNVWVNMDMPSNTVRI